MYGGWWGLEGAGGSWWGLEGAGKIAPIFGPLGEKVYIWEIKGLKKGVLGGWGLALRASGARRETENGG